MVMALIDGRSHESDVLIAINFFSKHNSKHEFISKTLNFVKLIACRNLNCYFRHIKSCYQSFVIQGKFAQSLSPIIFIKLKKL